MLNFKKPPLGPLSIFAGKHQNTLSTNVKHLTPTLLLISSVLPLKFDNRTNLVYVYSDETLRCDLIQQRYLEQKLSRFLVEEQHGTILDLLILKA